MNLKNINTLHQFETVADNWYQRTKNLSAIMNDENETKERRFKAGKLACIMGFRILKLNKISLQLHVLRQPKPSFKVGAIVGKTEDEYIIDNHGMRSNVGTYKKD